MVNRDKIEEVVQDIKKLSENKGYILNEEIEEVVSDSFDTRDIIYLYDRLSDENVEFFDTEQKARMKIEARRKREQKEARKSEELAGTAS